MNSEMKENKKSHDGNNSEINQSAVLDQREPRNNYRQKRLRLLIYPKFQLTLIGINLTIILLTIFFIGLQVHRSYNHMRELGLQVNLPIDHSYFKFVTLQENTLIRFLMIAIVLSFIISLVVTLFTSHKVAGPIVRLKSYFRDIAETGKVQDIRFRKNDFFEELPDLINSALKKISKK